jgi:hypothetical protein
MNDICHIRLMTGGTNRVACKHWKLVQEFGDRTPEWKQNAVR